MITETLQGIVKSAVDAPPHCRDESGALVDGVYIVGRSEIPSAQKTHVS